MNFAQPGFLLLALLAVPVWLVARASRAPLPRGQVRAVAVLQMLAVVGAAVALARPWRMAEGGVHRVVVVAGASAAATADELAELRAAAPQRDPFLVVRAGAAPVVGLPGATALPDSTSGPGGTPDLTAALLAAAAAVPDGARGTVHLWTDGRHDGAPLAQAANELRARGLAAAIRALPAPPAAAVALLAVEHPVRIAPGEAFRLAATVRATAPRTARLEVTAAGAVLAAADLQLAAGEQVRTVDVVVPETGLVELGVRLVGADLEAEATVERSAVLVDEPLRILHLAADPSRREALAASLRRHGIETFAPADPGEPLAGVQAFWDCRAVLVDDLPAAAWSANQGLVRAGCLQGSGLVLAGTHHNLGPGGYAGTALAELLPVRMPQREERRDPSVSLVLIVDTSGSMGGGRLELAKEVARLAMQKLQPHDKVGLIEFHGSKRWAAPLQPATNTIEITRALNRLQVGGGTIIFEALEESYYALLNAQTCFQHVLVLTDGGVESGPFETLARRMAGAGQTVSTVLIGPQANSPFLLNLAQWGRGRFYSCPDKFQLPDLQFREPQSALLPAVQERRVPIERANESEATAAFAGDQIAPSGGIVEASVRDGAEVLLRGSAGEPYLVGWDQGAGRVLVLAGQALGPQSGELHDDPAYGAFLADLLRSAAAGEGALAPRLVLQAQERGVRVRLHVPEGLHVPAPFVARLGDAACALAPVGDRAEGFLPWPGTAAAVVEVRCGDVLVAAGGACPPAPRGRRTADASEALRQLAAAATGRAAVPQPTDVGHLFALGAVLLFVAGLVLRRVPFDRGPAERGPGGPVRARPGAAIAGFALLALSAGLRAQDPLAIPPADEASVRAAIDAQLREHGDLAALAARWQAAPALHRYWLARAAGDLDAAQRICAEPELAASHRDVRVQILDVLGRPAEALAALGEPDPAATPVDRGHGLLRRGWLRLATGDRDGAAADLQAAVAAAGQREFAQQAGVLAAAFGFFELGLAWHEVGDEPGRDAFQAALRRGLWQQRLGRPARAAVEYELAFARAALQRDRTFALAMLAAAHRKAGSLGALADAWLARADGQGPPLHDAEIAALADVLRELGRARDGMRMLARLPDGQRAHFGELALTLAVEAGDPEAAIAQLQADLARRPDDVESRCSLAVLLADLQRDAEAAAVLRAGIEGHRARALRRLGEAASELGQDEVVAAIAAALAAGGGDEAGSAVDAALFEAVHLRRQGREAEAVRRLLGARSAVKNAQERLRLAEQLESLGQRGEAIDLYRAIWDEAQTEDIGMRLGWMLSESRHEADRLRAQEIFRQVWTSAGSAARRVQAEEHVLDLAAREGTLADLALELEDLLAQPAAPNRPAIRDALVKIYTRARDTTGAVAILQQWAAAEPERRVEALQQQARVHLSAEEFRNHERVLQQLLAADPEGELDYRQQLAMSALERGRPADARRHIEGLLGKPGTPDTVALEFSAGIYALAAQHEESVRLYRRALVLHPERVETFLLLGNALRAAGQRDAAIGTFQELLLRPLPDDLFVVAVDGLLNMEAPAASIAAAARAVRLRLAARPEQVFLHRVLQDLLEAQQDEAGRLRALEDTVVAAGEQRTNFVRELMQEAEVKRDWPTYADHGRTMLMLGDEVPPAVYLSLGEALLHTGDLDAAARSFARARLGTDFAAVEARTAELYENAGRLAEAERIRVRLLRRTPDDPAAALAVARLAERQGAAARALPHWLRTALRLLPAELDAGGAVGRRAPLARSTREPAAVAFAEPFAGALRCAPSLADLQPLREAIVAAAAAGAAPRRLAALRLLRHLARAYPDPELDAALRAGEDALLAGDDEATRRELRSRRLLAGDLAGAAAVPAGDEVTAEELRILLLVGEPAALAAAAGKARPALLPDLARLLLAAGRRAEAEALLPLAAASGDAAAVAVRDELRTLFGLPAAADTSVAQQRLAQALQRAGALSAKINLVYAALRDLPDLPAEERTGHAQSLAAEVIAAKDAAAAERLLAQGRGDLLPETAVQLVELSFTSIERVHQIPMRAHHLDALPTERAVELLRSALRRFREEERRQQLLQLFGNAQVPEAVRLLLVSDCDPRGVQGTDRLLFTNGLERAKPSPAVVQALAARFAAVVPDDPLTALLGVIAAGDGDAQRRAARAALPPLLGRRLAERDEAIVANIARRTAPDDARELLRQVPASAPSTVRVALAQRAGDKQAAEAALMAAHEEKPGDTARLYAAANFFESEGRFADAARLYRKARSSSPVFYPYQAQQLARLELLAGNALGALDALRAARDPAQSNFRLVLRVLAEVPDAALRRAALADVLQQRAARGAAAGIGFSMIRALSGGRTAAGDRLAAVLAPARLPPLAPKDLAEAEDAPSDYDLLAFLPEGEEAGRTLLRTLDDAARGADLGIYRGWLGAAARHGRAEPIVAGAVATLARSPHDAEAMRIVLAAAQAGIDVPKEQLRHVLRSVTAEGRLQATTIGSLIALAADSGEPELAGQVLRQVLQQRALLADAQLRPWMPGLFAMACQQLPALVLQLAGEGGLDSDAEAELTTALVLHHPDSSVVTQVRQAWPSAPAALPSVAVLRSNGSDLLPQVGAALVAGDATAAAALLANPSTYWLQARQLGNTRLAAAVPPLARWGRPEQAEAFGERLLALLADSEGERQGALARVCAVLVARLQAADRADAANELRSKLRAHAAAVSWNAADWLGE